jgi:hypothetical protein
MSKTNSEHFVAAWKETLKLTKMHIKNSKLTKILLNNTSLHCSNKRYKENNGTPIGSPISDIISESLFNVPSKKLCKNDINCTSVLF